MFFKLAARNVRRSIRDYAVYFITLMLSVCIFYMFNSLDAQMVMLEVGDSSLATNMGFIIGVISVFISVVLAFLIIYANNYIMRRRSREIGLYMLLGFSARRTALMLVLETLMIGLMALAAGLLAGYLASQGMSVLTAHMFGVPIRNYHFVFSPGAFAKTCIYFGVTFVVVILFTAGSISRRSLSSLIGSAAANEKFRVRRRFVAWLLLTAGIALAVFSYWLVLGLNMAMFVSIFGPALLINFVGTLFIFYGISGLMTAGQKRVRRRSLRGLRVFTERQLLSRVNTNAVSMTFICTMIFLTLVIVSSVSSMNSIITRELDEQAPVDVSLTAYQEGGAPEAGILHERLLERGIDDSLFADYTEFRIYATDVDQGTVASPDAAFSEEAKETFRTRKLGAVSLSGFNSLMQLQGRAPLTLEDGTYALCSASENSRSAVTAVPGGTPVEVGGTQLIFAGYPVQATSLWTSTTSGGEIRLIVPDAVALRLPAELTVFNANYAVNTDVGDQLLKGRADLDNGLDPARDAAAPLYRAALRTEVLASVQMSTVSIVYVGLYVGMILLVAGAAILALQQLSGAADDKPRYELLSRLGAGRRMIDRAVFSQTAAYFLLPLLFGAVHSVFGIWFMTKAMGAIGVGDIAAGAVSAALFICAIYGVYFAATYFGETRILRMRQVRTE
ncbi:MAG: FtsX-like permease family protein [Clostridia bacterium]|nr:FtsX-like permease family protein [Clostridia bacterium]